MAIAINALLSYLSTTSPLPPTTSNTPASTKLGSNKESKQALLTLHALLPTILLPALDLLDRRRVLCLRISNSGGEATGRAERKVYYVYSSSSLPTSTSTFASSTQGKMYEVRPAAWSCTCPAFLAGLLQEVAPGENVRGELGSDADSNCEKNEGVWGGSFRLSGRSEESVPVCKHLLACVLAERWGVAEGMVERRVVGREEGAAWAAGWAG